MEEPMAYFNGALLPLSKVAISADDGGLLYGEGLFETVRIYAARPFLWEQHLQRLQEGAALLSIPLPEAQLLSDAVEQVIKANAVKEGSLRLTVTGGAGRRALWPRPPGGGPGVLITVRHHIPYPDHLYDRGYGATTISFPRHENSPLVKIKSLNFLENILGKREALEKGFDEGLFLNTRGELTEATAANLFLFDGKTLLTPPVQCGLLPGITRKAVLSLARELAVPAEERVIRPGDLMEAEEAFLTASLLEVMPLVEYEGMKIGNGKPGPLSRALRAAYRNLARM